MIYFVVTTVTVCLFENISSIMWNCNTDRFFNFIQILDADPDQLKKLSNDDTIIQIISETGEVCMLSVSL